MTNPAETYEEFFVPVIFGPAAGQLVEIAAPVAGDQVLDVACGTGAVLRRVAAVIGNAGALHGVDTNPAMLAVARRVADRDGLSAELHETSVDALPFAEGVFDVVLCSQGLQFFPDRRAALAEMHRVLRPGGRLAVGVWQDLSRHPFQLAHLRALEAHLGVRGATTPFSLGDEDELRALLEEAGFETVAVESATITGQAEEPDELVARMTDAASAGVPAMQQLEASERQGVVEAVTHDLRPQLEELTNDGRVALTFHAHLARATRG